MKKLFGFVGKGWFVSLLGTIALALLIWYAGDLVSLGGRVPLSSPTSRLTAIIGLFTFWGLWRLGRALLARLRNRRLVNRLSSQAPEEPDPAQAASAEELEILNERFQEALGVLKRSESKHRLGGRWLYQLPWYLIIGPPGCGKTTALQSSGLRFPLTDEVGREPVQGVGGTRNCDWWFAEDAVLLDTAGRYTTQDSYQQVDSAAWQGFLAMLKKHRPRRPINGVLVAVSLADLLQQSRTERAAHAQAIKNRLQELCGAFNVRFPVYVLFMKSDLIAGFMEYFADLDKEGRAQVWGATFAYDAEGSGPSPVDRMGGEIKSLVTRLTQRRFARLQRERDPRKRGLVFAFPQQFASLEQPIEELVREVFTPSRYEERPLLRGVYFTSGTQTGTPIDRVLAAIASSLGVARPAQTAFQGTGRGYFLSRLFQDVVFPEAGLAGLNPRVERRRRLLRIGAYGGAVAVTLLAALAWTLSYNRNLAYTDQIAQSLVEIDARIDNLPPTERDPLTLLPLLDTARSIPGGYADRDKPVPLLSGLGLYQGRKLSPQAERAYRRILRRTLLPLVILRLEDQIREAAGNPEFLYDALRMYLMLDAPDHYDGEALQYWVSRDWERTLPRATTSEQHEALKDHLQALLEQQPAPLPLELDGALVAQARAILNSTPLAERIYDRLRNIGIGSRFQDFSVADAAGDYAKLVFERRSGRSLSDGVPALYTYEGYHQGFTAQVARLIAEASKDRWILGPQAGLDLDVEQSRRLMDDVRLLYMRDYVAAWTELLDDIQIVAPRDLHHAAELARVLADKEESPLKRLLVAAAAQTELDRTDESDGAPKLKAARAASGFMERVNRYFGDEEESELVVEESPAAYVTRRFTWLHDLVAADEGQAPPIDGTLEAIDRLHLQLKSVGAAASTGRVMLAPEQSSEISELQEAAGELPEPVAQVLSTLAQDSADIIHGGMRAQLNRIWTAEILPFCREAIHDRYPFERGSSRETTLHDFGRFFGPGGLMDAFFKDNLSPLSDTSGSRWRWVGTGIGISDDILAQFQRAAVIREAFFLSGGKLPLVDFELEPLSLDPSVRQIMLDLGGQLVDYRQGPPTVSKLQWPSPVAPGRVRLVMVDNVSARPTLMFTGPWAWFRLLDSAAMQPTSQPELFKLRFSLAGYDALFDLRAVSVRNPFNLTELRGFRCPDRL